MAENCVGHFKQVPEPLHEREEKTAIFEKETRQTLAELEEHRDALQEYDNRLDNAVWK